MLDKTFSPAAIEAHLYQDWEASHLMEAGSKQGDPYTIMMPPPNVTGNLHLGHAFTFTLQDILIRYHRMKGCDTLWQPGTDHAGIATQMVVERMLNAEGKTRRELGRAKFLERVWAWKEESGGAITNQLRLLGASPDWPRERFTLDEGLSAAVRKVFVDLYDQGLIYKDKRLVNWDIKLQTALSDLEVENKESKGSMWHFKYPVEGLEGVFIPIATTRPETLFGDTAVAVNPEDERYASLIGKNIRHPLTDRLIPIVGDEHADPEKGTGAVKITPAHDFNDFEVGRRHNLPLLNIMDELGHLNQDVPAPYRGLERYEARKRVVEDMTSLDLFIQEEEVMNSTPYSDRSGVVVEPRLTDQWYVNAKVLAAPALKAVEEGRTKFVPEYWQNTYFEWLRNIQPWCISRQLWWGHQIPAWYGPDGHVFVGHSEAEVLEKARAHYGVPTPLTQDEDVLDTWFSSALWPFSTLGWPEKTPELDRYYPTDVLVTGHDIIFFWVARMMMMGIHFMGDVPFRTVYINALIRDEHGQKMSKTKGNVIDPLVTLEKYGADALRFTLASLAAPGRDIRFAETLVEGSRNFATKLWNAARFCEMNECAFDETFDPLQATSSINRWIILETLQLADDISGAIESYRFNEAASTLYQFIWGTFCDWYLEFAKQLFASEGDERLETQQTAAWVLDQILRLLHPFMPYITERLWANLHNRTDRLLMGDHWPHAKAAPHWGEVQGDLRWLIQAISEIRSVRAEMNIPPASKMALKVYEATPNLHRRLRDYESHILRLARISTLAAFDGALPPEDAKGAAQTIVEGATFVLPLAGSIDLEAEKTRLLKEIDKVSKEIISIESRLNNKAFVDKAPEDVVEINKSRLAEFHLAKEKLLHALERVNL